MSSCETELFYKTKWTKGRERKKTVKKNTAKNIEVPIRNEEEEKKTKEEE